MFFITHTANSGKVSLYEVRKALELCRAVRHTVHSALRAVEEIGFQRSTFNVQLSALIAFQLF